MRDIGVIFPIDRPNAINAAKRACDLLQQSGVNVWVEERQSSCIAASQVINQESTMDAIITLGGDGTLLRGALMAAERNVPVLGINLGHTGFLTEAEADNMEEAIQALLEDQFSVEIRPMLSVQLDDGQEYFAINDIAVSRGGHGRIIGLEMVVSGDYAGVYRGDGLIVATPTGSTGYSLSAGGPILAPGVHGMVVTPICTHSLQHRPMVVAGSDVIELRLIDDEEANPLLEIDGRFICQLAPGQRITIRRPEERIQLIRLKPLKFFTIVREKLAEWSR